MEQFGLEVARLATQETELKTEKATLQARLERIDHLIAEVQTQYFALARGLTEKASRSAPRCRTPEDVKPPINIEDDDESIVVTPRPSRAPALTPPPQAQPVSKPKQFDGIHARYPTVIRVDGAWTEVWCGICGTNVNSQRTFLVGLIGLLNHQSVVHKTEGNSYAACTRTCGRRALEAAEVELMHDGVHANLPIREAKHSAKPSADPGLSCTGNARLSGTKATPIAVAPPTTDHATLPQMGYFGFENTSSGVKSRPTEYEIFQNLEAEARAAGTPPMKKQRTSLAKANVIRDHDEAEYTHGEDDHPLWQRCR